MSENQLMPANIQLPAYMQQDTEVIQAQAASLITQGESVPKISIKGSRFTFVMDGQSTPVNAQALDMVILGVDPVQGLGKVFYAGQFTGGSETPDCMSACGDVPDARATNKQAVSCNSCPQNVWGSAKSASGNDIKACKDVKTLLVTAPAVADISSGTIWHLQVPPGSLKGLSTLGRELAGHGFPMNGVTVRISFDPTSGHPKLMFAVAGVLDQEQYNAAIARSESEDIKSHLHEPSAAPAPVAAPTAGPAPAAVPAPGAEPVVATFPGASTPPPVQTPVTPAPVQQQAIPAVTVPPSSSQPQMAPPAMTQTQTVPPQAAPPTQTVPPVAQPPQMAPPAQAAPPESPAPTAQPAAVQTDKHGVAFDPTVHGMSEGKPKLKADGAWAKRRGVSDEAYKAKIAEVSAAAAEPAPAQVVPAASSTPSIAANGPVDSNDLSSGNVADLIGSWGRK